ncbi:MAG: hypothetical protein ACI4PO_07485 [Faecousia sp.]
MDKMERKLRQRARRFETNDGSPKGWHSAAYHRHFEGYSEYMVTDAKGRAKIRRVYTAKWYLVDLEENTKKQLRAELVLCWAVMLLFFLFAGTRNIQVNKLWYMALIQAAVIACMVWNLSGILHFLCLPEKSTVGQYRKSFEASRKSSIGLLITFGVAGLAAFLQLIVGCEDFLLHLLCAGLYGVSLLLALVINRLNANIPFRQLENTNTVREDAPIID